MKIALAFALSLIAAPAIAQVGLPWPGPGGVASGAAPGAGPFVLKCHAVAVSSASVTPDVNCTGANRCYVTVSRYTGSGSNSVADTSSNTYTQVGTEATSSSSTGVTLWKTTGNASVSASFHWGNSTAAFMTMAGACFSDGSTDALDQTHQANSANQPGSITPGVNNELLVTGWVTSDPDSGTPTISAGFTLMDVAAQSANNEGGGMAYEIQTTATARNPTWSTTGGGTGAAIIASFK